MRIEMAVTMATLSSNAQLVGGVARRNEGDENAHKDHKEAQAAANPHADDSAGHEHGMRVFRAVFAAGKFNDGREHVEKGNEVENDRASMSD